MLDRSLYNGLVYGAAPNEKKNGRVRFETLSILSRIAVIFLSVLACLERIFLLPFQIVGKPIVWCACKIAPDNNFLSKAYLKFPDSLVKAILKVPAQVIFSPFCSIIFSSMPYENYQLHLDMGLASREIPELVKQCYELRVYVLYEGRMAKEQQLVVDKLLRDSNVDKEQLRQEVASLNRWKERLAESELAWPKSQRLLPNSLIRGG